MFHQSNEYRPRWHGSLAILCWGIAFMFIFYLAGSAWMGVQEAQLAREGAALTARPGWF